MVMVWEMLVREMATEVAFAVHRSLATAGAEGAKDGADNDEEEEEAAVVTVPRRGVPGPGPNSRTVCPNCRRGVPCSRFTLHLDKCLGHPGSRRAKQCSRF